MAGGVNLFDLAARISVDTSKSDKALTDTQKKVVKLSDDLKGLDKSAGATSSSIGSLGGSALPGLAGGATIAAAAIGSMIAGTVAAGKAIYELASAAMEMGGRLYDLSQQTNFSVETLSALGMAAETSGGSLESVAASLGIFQKHLEKANSAGVNADAILKAWNVDLKNNEVALEQVLLRLSSMEAGTTQTAYALELFGRSGKQMLAIMKESGGDLDEFKKRMAEAGLVISGEFAESMDDAGDNVTRLGQHFRMLKTEVGEQFVPQVNQAVLELTQFLKDNKDEIVLWGAAIANVTKDIFKWKDAITGSAYATSTWGGLMTDFTQSTQTANLAVSLLYRGIVAARNAMAGSFGGMTSGAGGAWGQIGLDVGGGFAAPGFTSRLRMPGTGGGGRGGRGGQGRASGDAAQRLKEQMRALATATKEANRALEDHAREQQRLAEIADSVNEAIFRQFQAIEDIQTGYPSWLRDANDFIVAKFKEGHAWDAVTMAIYRNNAARMEQLRVLGEGATRPRRVFELATGSETRPRFATDERAREEQEAFRHRMQDMAGDLTNILDRSIYDGFSRGAARGFATLASGLLDIVNRIFLARLEQGLAELLTGLGGSTTGGGGGWLSKIASWGISALGSLFGGRGGGGSALTSWTPRTILSGSGIPGFASGGFLGAGQWGVVGERGPELIKAGTQGATVTPNAGGNVTIVVYAKDAQSFTSRDTQAQVARSYSRILQKRALVG